VTLSRPGTAGYAEVAVVPASLAIPIDAALAPETAVSTIPNVVTALAALQEAARMNAGDDLLVAGATGGLASVFPGVAKALGAARVTGVVSRAENVEHAYDLGYDEVLVTDQLPTISATFHVIVDPVGGPTRRACLRLLRPMGRMITIGNASDTEEVLVGTNELWLNSIGVVGLSIGGLLAAEPDRALLLAATAIDLVRQGHVDVSHETLPLAGAAEAHRRIEARTARGRLVLTPQNEQRP
jgi:NADPH2:quinone reductase